MNQPQKKPMNGKKIVLFTMVGLIIFIIILSQISKTTDQPKLGTLAQDSSSKVQYSADSGAITKTPDVSKISSWTYNDINDKMTGKPNHYAQVQADELLDLKFPYNGGSTCTVTIRKKRGETNIYLEVDKGQFATSVDGTPILVKFDEKKAVKYYCSEPADGSTNTLFIDDANTFLSHLKKSEHMIIEAEFYDNGTQTMEFDTDGLVWK